MTDGGLVTHRRLDLAFDVGRLHADLDRVDPGEWKLRSFADEHKFRGSYADASLVAAANPPTGGRSVALADYRPTPLLKRCEYFREVLSHFDGRLRHVRLSSMSPGARLATHIDKYGKYSDDPVRFHIPIVTSAAASLTVAGETFRPAEGECWYVDTHLLHSATNRGTVDRIHLIVDCEISDALNRLLGFDMTAYRKRNVLALHEHSKAYLRREQRWARLLATR